MRYKKLICPRCGAIYPRWRLLVSRSKFACLSCGAPLMLSRDSAGRLGFVGGLMLFACAAVSKWIWGLETLWSWSFMPLFLVFAVVLGIIIRPLVAVLVLRNEPG